MTTEDGVQMIRPVTAAIGTTSQVVRYHADNGDGFARCRPDYALNPQTTHVFQDWVPGGNYRCQRNGCARTWNQLMAELGLRVLPHGNTKPSTRRTNDTTPQGAESRRASNEGKGGVSQ